MICKHCGKNIEKKTGLHFTRWVHTRGRFTYCTMKGGNFDTATPLTVNDYLKLC